MNNSGFWSQYFNQLEQSYQPSNAAQSIIDATKRQFRTITIGIVQEFDAVTQRAVVFVAIKTQLIEGSDGKPNFLNDPIVLYDVPVVYNYETYPLEVGDQVLLGVIDRGIANWKQTGGVSEPYATPQIGDLTNAVIMGIVRDDTTPIENFNPTDVVLRTKDNNAYVSVGVSGLVLNFGNSSSVITQNPDGITINQNSGTAIFISNDGSIEITPTNGKPCTINGNLVVNGNLTATSGIATLQDLNARNISATSVVASGINLQTHKHSATGLFVGSTPVTGTTGSAL